MRFRRCALCVCVVALTGVRGTLIALAATGGAPVSPWLGATISDEQMGTMIGGCSCRDCYTYDENVYECGHDATATEPIPCESDSCLHLSFDSANCHWQTTGSLCETSDTSGPKAYHTEYLGGSCSSTETTWQDLLRWYTGCAPNCAEETAYSPTQVACRGSFTSCSGTVNPDYENVERFGTKQQCDACD
jgi:hypothetical protein